MNVSLRGQQLEQIDELVECVKREGIKPSQVTHLVLSDNEIPSLVGLQVFSHITYLDLSYNRIEILSCLPSTITHLNVSHNRMKHLFGFEGLVNLLELDASDNQLVDISGLRQNVQLSTLKLNHNKITIVQFLEHLKLLESLELEYNSISYIEDIRAISCNANLKHLSLLGNPIEKIPFYKYACRNLVPGLITLDRNKLANPPRTPSPKRPNVTSPKSYSQLANTSALSSLNNSNSSNTKKTKKKSTTTKRTSLGFPHELGTLGTPDTTRLGLSQPSNNKYEFLDASEVVKMEQLSLSQQRTKERKRTENFSESPPKQRKVSLGEVLEKLEEILQRTKTTNYTAAKIEIIQQLEEHFKVEISEHYSFVSKIIQIWQNKTPTSRDDIRWVRMRGKLLALIEEKKNLIQEYERAITRANLSISNNYGTYSTTENGSAFGTNVLNSEESVSGSLSETITEPQQTSTPTVSLDKVQ